MMEIEKPRIDTVQLTADGTYGKFVMEPLERGYATTIGNSLRRVLLSILPGAAVTSVKIDGVVHEFSTIPGVKEDVTEIVLNLKGLIAKLHSDTSKKVYIEAEAALAEQIGRKVKITGNGKSGILQIEFFSDEDLFDLAEKLAGNKNG